MYAQANMISKVSNPAFVLHDHSPEDVARATILGLQKEPFFIFDMDEAYRRIQYFKHKLPRVQIFYAMKANDGELMLKLAVATGLGFDCASIHEIHKILRLNVPPTDIIYAVTMKTPEQMMYARQSGVKRATFDSPSELVKLKEYWPDVELLLRISVKSDSVYQLGIKFGCNFETEATDLLDKAACMGLRVAGVAFHVGSTCLSPESYLKALQQARYLFDYEAKAGRTMRILDIGGGFFCDDNLFEQATSVIRKGLDELFPGPNVQIVAEPGRYICETACNLYCNINNVKTITKNDKPLNMVYINDGLHGSLRSFEKWHTIHKFELETTKHEELEDTILWGPTSDPRDCLTEVQLPRCTPRDWLVFKTQGAYASTFSSKFCGFGLVQTRFLISFDLWNKIKSHKVFRPSDFVIQPDVSSPLQSTMPPVVPAESCKHTNLNTLIDYLTSDMYNH
ncbi:hypothetical protein O3G_MSEX008984 [Manduca sexta]|uniref:ornithine decarboxylase n=4 Tax=Manduca sexta TaxID=7130 RepID=A0A921ZBS6_MANSE|nr:hypothetical protein O3G_MSEX008984 [Manduca sexta]